jgi:hypothetical protein
MGLDYWILPRRTSLLGSSLSDHFGALKGAISYRVILDVPLQLAVFVSQLLAEHRREIGTETGPVP